MKDGTYVPSFFVGGHSERIKNQVAQQRRFYPIQNLQLHKISIVIPNFTKRTIELERNV